MSDKKTDSNQADDDDRSRMLDKEEIAKNIEMSEIKAEAKNDKPADIFQVTQPTTSVPNEQQLEKSLNLADGRLTVIFSVDDDATLIGSKDLHNFVEIVQDDDLPRFKSLPSQKQDSLISGKFDYRSYQNSKRSRWNPYATVKILKMHLRMTRAVFVYPFNIAVGYAAVNIVQAFIEAGVDMTRIDMDDANVLHALVLGNSMRRHAENDYITVCNVLIKALSRDDFSTLCHQENAEGHRPLELAAKLGLYGVFKAMVQQPGYLCGKSEIMGMSVFNPYDVSEYERGGHLKRMIRSPLRFMVYADREAFESMKTYKIFDLPIIKRWMTYKTRITMPFIMIWFLIRIVYLLAVSVVDPSVLLYDHMCRNYSVSTISLPADADDNKRIRYTQCKKMDGYDEDYINMMLSANLAIQIWSSIMIALHVIEFALCMLHKDRRRAYHGQYFCDFVGYTRTYRIAQFSLYVLGVIGPAVAKTQRGGESFQYLLFLKAFELPLCLMSFLYMVEFLPLLGIFAITLQRMVKSLFVFLAFLLPVKFLFSQFFLFFASDYGFTEFQQGLYILFLMDMGAHDFGFNPELIVKVAHVFYYLVMIVLLFNYLIAVLSVVADQTGADRIVLVQLRRLQTMCLVEERFTFWFWSLIFRIQGKKPVILHAQSSR